MLITKQQQRVDMPAGVNSLDGNIVPSPTPPSVITQNSCHQKSGTIVRHMEETKALKVSLKHAQDVIQTIQVDALLGETQETMGRSRYSSDTSSSEAIMGERSEEVLDLKLPQSPIIDISAEGDLVDNMDNESSNSSQAIALQANQYRNSVASRRNSTPTCTCLIKNHMPTSTNDVLIKEKEIYLTCVDLPAISNHEMYNSFSSSSISNSSSGNTSKAKIQIMKHNQEYYGSLIKEPESYIYRSQIKDRVEEKENLSQSSLPTLPSITANLDSMVNMNHSETKQEIKKTETGSSSSFATAMAHTMIGEWIWKYTRKVVGSGISEHRHRRFFWINPYTRTLYWSIHVPGANGNQLSTKSVLIDSFKVLDDPHERSRPPGIFIKTPTRGIKIQCLDFSSHYAWVKSLEYLLSESGDGSNHILSPRKKPSHVLKQTSLQSNSRIKEKHNSEEKEIHQPTTSTVFNNSMSIDISSNSQPFIDFETVHRNGSTL